MIAFLSLGSNVGDRESYLKEALGHINDIEENRILKISSIYETEPWGRKSQRPFLNQVIEVATRLTPEKLLTKCQAIEKNIGRVKKEEKRWGPRRIDIDILIYDRYMIDNDELKIPHPCLRQRRFILVPLNEIARDLIIPGYGKSVQNALKECRDGGRVEIFTA